MKRLLSLMALLMIVCFSFAQVKNVKEAKSAVGGTNPDLGKAEDLIGQALIDPTTKDDPNTWYVAGYIQQRINEKEMENAYLKKSYDTLKAYNSILNMYNYFLKCDDLAQIPDAKGKIKNKFRKDNLATLLIERPNLINGGIIYFNKNNNEKALEFFSTYIDVVFHPIFESQNFLVKDTMIPQVAYFTSLAAMRLEDYPSVIKYALYGEDDKETGKFVLEYLATAYQVQKDTLQRIEILKKGVAKYPDHPFFYGHLIDYYTNQNLYDEAMKIADDMVNRYPDNAFYLYVKGYLYHNIKDYDHAVEFYKKTVEADPNYAEAYSNLGLIYCLKAQEYAEKSTAIDMKSAKYKEEQAVIKSFYAEARPYYEKTRELKPDKEDLWLQGLYRIYYNLNMGKEFEEIERLM